MFVKASQIKLKDSILLDFGYGPRSDWRSATVIRIHESKKLFGEGNDIGFSVKSGTESMETAFDPNDLVELTVDFSNKKTKLRS